MGINQQRTKYILKTEVEEHTSCSVISASTESLNFCDKVQGVLNDHVGHSRGKLVFTSSEVGGCCTQELVYRRKVIIIHS